MRVAVLGSGVQGTIFAVKLSQAGHDVTLVSRGRRAEQLVAQGAQIENVRSGERFSATLQVTDHLDPAIQMDVCLVTVRREQLQDALPMLQASSIPRLVFLMNDADGFTGQELGIGKLKKVLAFPGVAGALLGGVVHFAEVVGQSLVVDKSAHDIVSLLRCVDSRLTPVADMPAWLARHAVFIVAFAGGFALVGGSATELASNMEVRKCIFAGIEEGWACLDEQQVGPAPLALRAIFSWVPRSLTDFYWRRLFASPEGELYFGQHFRHATSESKFLAEGILLRIQREAAPNLRHLIAAL